MRLGGKVAIVTGAGKGIGVGIVKCLAQEGADIVVNSLHQENAEKVAGEVNAIGRSSLAMAVDITKKEGADEVVQAAMEKFGHLDILVNNFGAHTDAFYTRSNPKFTDQKIKEWDDDYGFNLRHQVLMCMATVPIFQKQQYGKIINISSIAGKLTIPSQMPYGSFKAGSIYFTRTLAVELAQYNINVNCICPGTVYSGMSEKGLQHRIDSNPDYKGMTPRQYYERFIQPKVWEYNRTPLKRELFGEDIGWAVVFFASEESRNITGQTLTVDCGLVTY